MYGGVETCLSGGESGKEERVQGTDGQMLVDDREMKDRQSTAGSCYMWRIEERQ